MTKIHVLPPAVANVIAAGEVVERPASVVKELVENAIDAGATEIVIRLDNAGKSRMTVSDNGCGMNPEDAVLALQRHATSKLRVAEDLHRVRTLGFRGEALPSIAAVSAFRLTTRTADASCGTEVRVDTGQRVSVREIGAPVGTTVEVRELFATIPARRKFLKGERTELAHIQDFVTRLALAVPQIRFRLEHGGRVLLACHTTADLLQRLQELFGAEMCTQIIPLREEGAMSLCGYCGSPRLARPGASQLYTVVNGRPIRDRVIQHAIIEGYRTFIPHGEQPFAVLLLTVPPDEVDVNVHPAKAEVRFVQSGAVHHYISTAVRKCLEGSRAIEATRTPPQYDRAVAVADHHAQRVSPLQVSEALAFYQPRSPVPDAAAAAPAPFKPLGQIAATYLLYEAPGGGLLIVDQHAAHERIGYEALKATLQAGTIERQVLLTPCVVELGPTECAALETCAADLATVGFEIEPFGERSVAVISIPTLLGATVDVPTLLREIAAEVHDHGRSTAVEARLDHLLATMACHAQIRAGDRLVAPELAALVDDLQRGMSKDRCPHGRPTWVAFPKAEIEKWFKRR